MVLYSSVLSSSWYICVAASVGTKVLGELYGSSPGSRLVILQASALGENGLPLVRG